ncbi:MAG: tetratricopeptide repeat protein [Bacteroidales bacterium]|nr:tetratricopeptide repeat protein [Bacteroidales bacterium]
MKLRIALSLLMAIAVSTIIQAQEKNEDYTRSEVLIEEEKYEEAAIILDELCKQFPDNYEYFRDLGYAHLNMFNFDEAIIAYNKAVELNKDCYKCYSHLARAWYEKGEYSKAEQIIASGFAITDTTAHLYMTRGLIYMSTDRGDLALKDFSKAIELAPDDEDYYILRANYYLTISEGYNSYSDISNAIKINPNNAEYYYYRAYILTNLNVHDEALIDIDKAIKLSPNYADYYNLKFTIHMNRGEYDQAEQAVIKSIEIKPNDYYAHLSLGDLYMQISNMDRFCDCYSRAIELHPVDNPESKDAMIYKYDKYCIEGKMPYYFVRALGFYNESNYNNCISTSETGIKISGPAPILYNIKASAHLSKLEYDKARVAYDSCIMLKANLKANVNDFYSYPISDSDAELVASSYVVKSHFGLAIIYLVKKEYDSGLVNIIKAIEKAESLKGFDGLELLYVTKGLIYLGKNDFDNAEKNFKIAQEKNPYSVLPRVNLALLSVLKSVTYNPKKLLFTYEPGVMCPRVIIPAVKLPKEFDAKTLEPALEICNTVIEFQPESPYAYLVKAKIQQLLGDKAYCETALMAREYGLFNSFAEIGADCK